MQEQKSDRTYIWNTKIKLWAEGNKMIQEGDRLLVEGHDLFNKGRELSDKGQKQISEAHNLRRQGTKVRYEADFLFDSGPVVDWPKPEKSVT